MRRDGELRMIARYLNEYFGDHNAKKFLIAVLAMLLVFDFLFILAHINIEHFGGDGSRFSIARDRGYPECFGYMKQISAAGFLLWAARRSAAPTYILLGLIMCYFMFDDFFMIHENIGAIFSTLPMGGSLFNLTKADTGQLIYFLILGMIILIALCFAL